MIKALHEANKSERVPFRIPRSVQQSIPIQRIYADGIWQVGSKHSKTWRFSDINYAAASDEDRRSIFLSYGGVLNSLPTDAAAKITIINRRLNPVDFRRTILMKERGDGLDQYRQESNRILTQRAAESNNLVQEKYITLSIAQRKIDETRAYFRRVDGNLAKSFGRLDSGAQAISNHQRMIFAVVTLVHVADTLEQLDADTETLLAIGREHLCQFSVLRYQQEDGLNTVLPYGLRRVKTLRTLTTESAAVLMPFRAQEIQDSGGLSYGINVISKNLLICDRKRLISPHGFYLGVSGSGKSMGMKSTIENVVLATDDDVIIIDAEREYGPLASALGGEIIEISPSSRHHINPLELTDDYGDGENPIAMKSEIITSILEQQMGAGRLTGSQKSIIDRCTTNIYQTYFQSKGKAPMPLLTDWRNEVLKQADPEAREIALAAELITEGSLNVFAHPGNVNMDNRIVVLDPYEMGEQLRPTALVVTLEAIQNRVMENRKKGKYTWVFIDEVYLYFKYHYSGEFLYRAWKRFRKYAGIMTAATQNVEECLKSETARLMLANSEFLLLFNQAATDREELARLLHISSTQMGYITNAEPGHGLMRVGGSLVPFANTIPRDSELYRLMSANPGER